MARPAEPGNERVRLVNDRAAKPTDQMCNACGQEGELIVTPPLEPCMSCGRTDVQHLGNSELLDLPNPPPQTFPGPPDLSRPPGYGGSPIGEALEDPQGNDEQ